MKALKQTFYLILVLLSVLSVVAQKYKLIESNHISDDSKDCRKIGNCLGNRYLKDDSLHVTIYTDNQFRDLNAYRDSFTIDHDTLSLNLNDTNAIRYTYVFNKEKNKIDTLTWVVMTIWNRMDDGYDTRRNEYILTGFTSIPKAFQFNHANVCNCPTLPLKFDILNKDTINMINANGLKQGVWIIFFDTGEIEEKKYFDKGLFTGGQMFDKKGNDLHAIYQSENMTLIMTKDTLIKK